MENGEADRRRKRITVALSSTDAAAVNEISAMHEVPSSRVVARMISDGMMIEQRGRLTLDRPQWPTHPADPRYVAAAFSPFDFLDLVELAETAFEPLSRTASALFKLGLAAFEDEPPKRAPAQPDFG
jgi:hypothetical protein